MTEHFCELIQMLDGVADVSQHIIVYMDGPTERAVWDTGRAMLSIKWNGHYWECDESRGVSVWSIETRKAYDLACNRLQVSSRIAFLDEEIQESAGFSL